MNKTYTLLKPLVLLLLWLLASGLCMAMSLVLVLISAEYGLKSSPSLQQTVVDRLQKSVPFSLRAESLELDFFPLPQVRAEGIEIKLPQVGPARADRVELRPSPASLLRGRLRLASAVLIRPRLDLSMKAQSPDNERPRIQDLVRILNLALPRDARLRIVSGSLSISPPEGKTIHLDQLTAHLNHDQKFTLDIQATSNLVRNLDLSAKILKDTHQLQGQMKMHGLQADQIVHRFNRSQLPLWLGPGAVDAEGSFTVHNDLGFKADLDVTTKDLILCTQDDRQDIKGLALQISLSMQEASLYAQIHRLSFGSPRFSLSGQIATDLNDPWLQLSLQGNDLLVPPLGNACLDLFPQSEFLNKLFGVIRAGTIPHVYVSTHGSTAEELKQELQIQAHMRNGTLRIPKVDVLVQDAKGYAWVKDKILAGSGLSARMDQVQGWEASFRYGLEDKEDRAFGLSMQVAGPVKHIPPILKKTVKDKDFLRELNGLAPVQGQVEGELHLDKKQQGLDFDIQARKFNLHGGHKRLPWPVTIQGQNLHITNHRLALASAQGDLGPSRVQLAAASLAWGKTPQLNIESMTGQLDLATFWPWLQSLPLDQDASWEKVQLKGGLNLQEASVSVPFSTPAKSRIDFAAQVDTVQAEHPSLSHPLHLSSGRIHWGHKHSSAHNLSLHMNDGQGTLEASLPGSPLDWEEPGLELSFTGNLGAQSAHLVQKAAGLPDPFFLQGPVDLRKANFKHTKNNGYDFQGQISFDSQISIQTHILWDAKRLEIKSFELQEKNRRASLSLLRANSRLSATYSGELRPSSLQRIFHDLQLSGDKGLISGHIQATGDTAPWRLARAKGELSVNSTQVHLGPDLPPLTVSNLRVTSSPEPGLQIASSELSWNDHHFRVHGHIQPHPSGPTDLDMAIASPGLNWSWLNSHVSQLATWFEKDRAPSGPWPVQGKINIRMEQFRYRKRTFAPLHLTWKMTPDGPLTVHILEHSRLCGISVPGKVSIQPDKLQFTVAPSSSSLDLAPALKCLLQSKDTATGTLDLHGHVQAAAPAAEGLSSNLDGELNFTVTDGRLLRFSLLAKLVEVLNSTEILFGSLPDLENEGIRFSSLQGTARMHGERIVIDKGLVDGHSLEMGFQGHLDIQDKTLDLTVLVAPLKTVDRLVKKIPIISGLTRGNLITIPVRISGSWKDPKVTPLSPQAVSKELVDLMRRALEWPFQILQPFMSPDNEKE